MMAFDELDFDRDDDDVAPLNIESAAAIALQPAEPIAFDVEIMLPADDAPILIFGPPASLKTWIAMHLLAAIVTGEKFLGRYVVRRRPRGLYMNLDAGPKTFRNRVRRVTDAEGFDLISMSASEFTLSRLRRLLAEYRDGFIVLDCLSSIYNPDRTKDPAFAMRQFVDDLRALFAEFNCGGVVIDHPHRPKERGEIGDYHGSVQKEAAFRGMWAVNAEPADGSSATRRTIISCRKLSEGQPFSPVHVNVRFDTEWITFTVADHDPDAAREDLETRMLAWGLIQSEPFSKNSAERAIAGGRAADKRNAFDRLVMDGTFDATGKKRGGADLYLHRSRTSSSSGTKLDEVDEAGHHGPPGHFVPSSPSIGDEVPGTRCGTKSGDEPGLLGHDGGTRRAAGTDPLPSGSEIPARRAAEDIE